MSIADLVTDSVVHPESIDEWLSAGTNQVMACLYTCAN